MKYPEYSGMSYEQASRAAEELIEREGWYRSFDRLQALREIMKPFAIYTTGNSPLDLIRG